MKHIPFATGLFALLAGCSGHLVFFTNTSLGLDVSADASTGAPKVVIGYKRQEGAVFPVEEDVTEDLGKLTDEAFSVLAKYSGGAGYTDSELTASQFFATGQAAIELARHSSAALTNNPKVAEAIASAERHLLTSASIPTTVKVSTIWTALKALEDIGTDDAMALLEEVDQFASVYRLPDFDNYLAGAGTSTTIEKAGSWPSTPGTKGRQWLTKYFDSIDKSIARLQQLQPGGTMTLAFPGGTQQPVSNFTTAEAKQVREALDSQRKKKTRFERSVRDSKEVSAALAAYIRLLGGTAK